MTHASANANHDHRDQPILVVDDDATFRNRLMIALRKRGFETHGAADFTEAMAVAQQCDPARAIVDLRMPGESGLTVLKHLIARDPDIEVVVLTGYGSIATTKEAIQLGARDYLTKPADTEQILTAFDRDARQPDDEADDSVPSLARVEWEHIQRILADCDGNVSQAARLLRIHRRSLQRKLSKYAPGD